MAKINRPWLWQIAALSHKPKRTVPLTYWLATAAVAALTSWLLWGYL